MLQLRGECSGLDDGWGDCEAWASSKELVYHCIRGARCRARKSRVQRPQWEPKGRIEHKANGSVTCPIVVTKNPTKSTLQGEDLFWLAAWERCGRTHHSRSVRWGSHLGRPGLGEEGIQSLSWLPSLLILIKSGAPALGWPLTLGGG